MGQMKRFKKFGIIEGSSDDREEEEPVKYCIHCLEFGFKRKLGPRKYILAANEEIPADHEEWLQCPNCGNVYAKHEARTIEQLEGVKKTVETPFEVGKNILGLQNLDRGRQTDLHRRIKRIKKEIAAEPDPDIKAELRRGNTVTIVEDNNMYDRKVKKNFTDSDWN